MKITQELVDRVLAVVDAGLTSGLGNRRPGQMCVEAAVCYALGEPHGDEPSCVGSAVREFKIRLNDSHYWPNDKARARGMRRLAIAQLGSDTIDQGEFARQVTFAVVREIIAPLFDEIGLPDHGKALRGAGTFPELRSVATDAVNAAYAAYAADADAASSAAAAAYAAYAADATAAYADADADADADAAEKVLCKTADIAERVLAELGSPGARFLGKEGFDR